jgi:hypothetical protein
MKYKATQFNLQTANNNIEQNLLNLCKVKTFLSNLQRAIDFFESSMWTSLHSTPNGHAEAYEFLSKLFGADGIMIYDGITPIFDTGNLFSKMSTEEKTMLQYIEDNKPTGVFIKGNFIFQYIGTVYILPITLDIKIDISVSNDINSI